MQNEDRLRDLLSDLGRSTLRGVRKCPKCGTYNGTRGLVCKNKDCSVTLKEPGEKKKHSIEVCKLDTGTFTQVYSVRTREKGPDYRGFVQLPQPESPAYLSALCFVDSCQRLFNTGILKCHEERGEADETVISCQHIGAALKCSATAQILHIAEHVLPQLNITPQVTQEVWELWRDTPGPLVQRVSKTVMVVKCAVSSKHPLGFLHVSFLLKPKDSHFSCTCRNQNRGGKCVHYWACICAFSSDMNLEQEFSQFVDPEKIPPEAESVTVEVTPVATLGEEEVLNSILNDQCVVQVDNFSGSFLEKHLILHDTITQQDLEGLVNELTPASEAVEALNSLPTPNTIVTNQKVRTLKRKKESENGDTQRSKVSKKGGSLLKRHFILSEEKLDATKVHQTFIEWLSSVTERINQTMHFQFDGKPDPLVFHTPHVFFECLMERVVAPAVGMRRRRLPNKVAMITRRHTPPLGVFHCYTWHISNILHAKAIFDTPLMVLNVTRSFVHNPDGTYDEFDPFLPGGEAYHRSLGEPNIRPVQLKTYLKIGKTSPDQTAPSLLSIDWTPNILPLSKIGELKITFEYGHTQPHSSC